LVFWAIKRVVLHGNSAFWG